MVIHYRVTVKGLVQGVSYRQFTKTKAQELGVCGFVQNQRDGGVYIEAEAEEEVLQKLVDWCHYGPPKAKVQSVEVETGVVKGYENFTIKF